MTAVLLLLAQINDHHQHLYSPEWVKLNPAVEMVDADALIRRMDAAGIRRALILSTAYAYANPNRAPLEDELARVRAENDWTSRQVARYPDRLTAYCGVNPLKDYALAEIERCARDRYLRAGLKLHFGNSDVRLDDPDHLRRVQAVFGAANQRRMPVLVHLRPSVTKKRPYGAAFARRFLEDVLPRAARVPVQIAHLAGAGGYDDPEIDEALAVFVEAVERGDRRVRRLWFDVSGVAGLGVHWAERKETVARRIRQLGLARVTYGTDSAQGAAGLSPLDRWKAFRQLPLTEAEFVAIERNTGPPWTRKIKPAGR